jgi:hypothetical protein
VRLSKVSLLLFLLALFQLFASAATIIVNSVPSLASCPAQYSTIQAGVDAANAGDIVYVCSGSYNEQVSISKNITLTGQSGAVVMPSGMAANARDLSGGSLAAAIYVYNASNVIVSGLILDGTNNGVGNCKENVVGIYYQNSGGTIVRNTARHFELESQDLLGCRVGVGVYAESNDNAANNVSILQNSIHDYQKDGIQVNTPGYTSLVESNTVRGIGSTRTISQNGIEIDAAGVNSSIVSNTVTENLYACPPGCFSAAGIRNFANNVSVRQNSVIGTSTGIYYVADNATISNNNIANTTSDGIYLQDTSADAGSTISSNSVTDSSNGIEAKLSSTNVIITNNAFVEAAVGIENDNASVVTLGGNSFSDIPVPIENGLPQAGADATQR